MYTATNVSRSVRPKEGECSPEYATSLKLVTGQDALSTQCLFTGTAEQSSKGWHAAHGCLAAVRQRRCPFAKFSGQEEFKKGRRAGKISRPSYARYHRCWSILLTVDNWGLPTMLIGGNFRDVQTCLHLRRVQFLACTACRVVIRSNTLARGGSRVRATRTVFRLQVRPVVSHNEDHSLNSLRSC